jgi:hypothetical protein
LLERHSFILEKKHYEVIAAALGLPRRVPCAVQFIEDQIADYNMFAEFSDQTTRGASLATIARLFSESMNGTLMRPFVWRAQNGCSSANAA